MKMTPPDSLSGKDLAKWFDFGNEPSEIVSMGNGLDDNTRLRLKYQRYIKDYLATIKSVDDNIGRVLDYLSENDLEDNTIIIYASDQGFFLGDHGWFDKRFMYEEALRMPFVIRYPKKIKAKTSINDVISNTDIAPTILDMAGVESPEDIQGNSFFKQLKGVENNLWRQSMYYHYYEYPFWHHVQPHYGIRTERYKLIHFYYDMDVWELYDFDKDPSEMTNLIDDLSYKKIVSKLKQDLNDLKTHYGNNLSLEELRQISDTDFGGLESKKKKSSK
jgi:arylsulfatase A-like enzyme